MKKRGNRKKDSCQFPRFTEFLYFGYFFALDELLEAEADIEKMSIWSIFHRVSESGENAHKDKPRKLKWRYLRYLFIFSGWEGNLIFWCEKKKERKWNKNRKVFWALIENFLPALFPVSSVSSLLSDERIKRWRKGGADMIFIFYFLCHILFFSFCFLWLRKCIGRFLELWTHLISHTPNFYASKLFLVPLLSSISVGGKGLLVVFQTEGGSPKILSWGSRDFCNKKGQKIFLGKFPLFWK